MRKIFCGIYTFLCLCCMMVQAQPTPQRLSSLPSIAVISDPHIMDVTGHPELLRSMEVQVQSTRLFNENIFAFRAALDDVAQQQISLVVIPGDMTDDGQILNQEAARALLQEYEERYGMRFFLTPGNHDPKTPFGQEMTGRDYLTDDGSRQTLASHSSLLPPQDKGRVEAGLHSVGHQEQMLCYARNGYMPRTDYLFWSTPFAPYGYDDYSYEQALKAADVQQRTFVYADSIRAIDASYVAEPINGLWLLSLDAGVYLPEKAADGSLRYRNSGAGYNLTLQHKPYLLEWVRKIASEAKSRGKQLVTFSHFPMVDFNDGASDVLARAWGRNKFDIERVPPTSVSRAWLDAGVRLHFGGHMHINDTGTCQDEQGNTLYNIQVPSLATGIPSYKVLDLSGAHPRIRTRVVEKVPGFDTFFARYQQEWDYDLRQGKQPVWSHEALQSADYLRFCDWQFRDLVRIRFCQKDLPEILRNELLPHNGQQLLQRLGASTAASDMSRWTGYDLILDLYRLHYSGSLALRLIPASRLQQYELLFQAAEGSKESSEFVSQLRDLGFIFHCFLNGKPDAEFELIP